MCKVSADDIISIEKPENRDNMSIKENLKQISIYRIA